MDAEVLFRTEVRAQQALVGFSLIKPLRGSYRRCLFRVGDFAYVLDRPGGDVKQSRIARIDGVFVHRYLGTARLFVVLNFMDYDFIDYVLRASTFKMTEARAVVGLPRIGPHRAYMVPAKEASTWMEIKSRMYVM